MTYTVTIVAGLVMSVLIIAVAGAEETLGLFNESAQTPAASQDASVVQRRNVLLNPDLYPHANREPGFSVPMNFFPGQTIRVVLDTVTVQSEDRYTWIGHVQGEGDGGTATIVVQKGHLMANVRSESIGTFQIRSNDAGVIEVRQIDTSKFIESEPLPQSSAGSTTPVSATSGLARTSIGFLTIALLCVVIFNRLRATS